MKHCIVCNVPLNGTNTTWYRQKNWIHKCNECTRVEKREWSRVARLADPATGRARSMKHKTKLQAENPRLYSAQQMASSARKRATAMGVPYDLDGNYIASISPVTCPIFGYQLGYGGGEKSNESPSLDRIVPSLGYVRGNVQVISLLGNLMKSSASQEQLRAFAEWILDGDRAAVNLKR